MKITDRKYLKEYSETVGSKIPDLVKNFDFAKNKTDSAVKNLALYSFNAGGNAIDCDLYLKDKLSKDKFAKQMKEIDELSEAYKFAQKNKLNEKNLLKAHEILSGSLLPKGKQGKYRTEPVGVFEKLKRKYLAIEHVFVASTMKGLFEDLEFLLEEELSPTDAFYYASLLHLRLAHVHPFRSGNGRVARLAEKWFLNEKLGKTFWQIPSEKYYMNHQMQYFDALNLGASFYELNYDDCMPFLIMLGNCLK